MRTALRQTASATSVPAWAFVAWGCLIVLALRFVTRDALRYFALDEMVFGRFWPRKLWLLAHITGGIVALLLGPVQFWPGLRRKALAAHRWTGRLYLMGVLTAAGSAFHLAFFIPPDEGGWPAGVALFTLACVWLTASAMALVAIRGGLVGIHKEWMIRSYVLTFAFVTLRWWGDFPVISSTGTVTERIVTISWVGWALPLLVTQMIFEVKRMRRESLAPARSSV